VRYPLKTAGEIAHEDSSRRYLERQPQRNESKFAERSLQKTVEKDSFERWLE